MLNLRAFVAKSQPTPTDKRRNRQKSLALRGELLEPRLPLAWTGVAPASISLPPSSRAITFDLQQNAVGAAAITAAEVDYYSLVPPASGSYRVATQTPNSPLDTVIGVFDANGRRLAHNDDTASGTDSQLTLNLAAGSRYYIGITSYGLTRGGTYTWLVDGPTPATKARADLTGATLAAANASAWGQTIAVQSSVRNGGQAASGSFQVRWYLSRDTVGSSDDVLLFSTRGAGAVNHPSIAAGSTGAVFNRELQLPASPPAGWSGSAFYVIMRTDATNLVSESNENNNFGQIGPGVDRDAFSFTTSQAVAPTHGFHIELTISGMTAAQRAIFQQAADRWEQVITGDLPNAVYNGRTVDDLLIEARGVAIDGVGRVLGQAGPDRLRSGSSLPYHGIMEFDTADLAELERNGSLFSVVLHEIGHVLGVGTLWNKLGLLSGGSTSNPRFTGTRATAAYNQLFGSSLTSVPVENSGGAGTRDSHWRESVFGIEAMTGYLGPGLNNPLSLVTIASLADLGYQVNLATADSYSPVAVAAATSTTLIQSNSTASLRREVFSPAYPTTTDTNPHRDVAPIQLSSRWRNVESVFLDTVARRNLSPVPMVRREPVEIVFASDLWQQGMEFDSQVSSTPTVNVELDSDKSWKLEKLAC